MTEYDRLAAIRDDILRKRIARAKRELFQSNQKGAFAILMDLPIEEVERLDRINEDS